MNPKISLVLPTARKDYPLVGEDLKPMDIHVFQPTLDSLEKQSFKSFELIIVDALKNRDWTPPETFYPVRRVYPHRSFWLDRGMWAVASGLNTGIIEADGEFLVFLNDCCQFNPDFLERYWNWYQRGYWASALTLYNRGGKPLCHGENRVRDSRWAFLENSGVSARVLSGSCFFGYSSCPLESALDVNGFDELFDGCKSEEDPDFGIRLEARFGKKLVVDSFLTVIENAHLECCKDTLWYQGLPPKCNDAILRLNRFKNRTFVNVNDLTPEDFETMKKLSTQHPCSVSGGKDYDLGEIFDVWASNPPDFNLRDKRRERCQK